MNRKVWLYAAGLLIIFAILAVTNFFGTGTNADGAITVVSGQTEKKVTLSSLKTKDFSGTTVNGKGDKLTADYKGAELRDVLTQNGFDLDKLDSIEVAAQDKFTAKLTADEVRAEGKVYIIVEKNGEGFTGIDKKAKCAQLLVLGDKDSKRCVNYLEKITLNAK